ncbi:MAG TPA: carbamoyltransferase [Polyangia bacterium]|nr:carbamoyltransferase [Polyangia bacterium]
MLILGLSAFYHDSAAALIRDGEIVAAAQEERFTRIRHDSAFPREAVAYCLREAGATAKDLDYVCFYDKPLKKFDRILETYFAYAPKGFVSFKRAIPLWLRDKLHTPRAIRKGMEGAYQGRLIFTDHHESHAASAFFPSPFDEAAILTSDGVGEWATTTYGVGQGNRIRIDKAISFPHSLGLLYSAFTYFTGFKVNSGEYKLMGLAPYGRPVYADVIKQKLIDIKPDGSYRLDMDYFTYASELRMTGEKFAGLFGGPARKPESDITQREMDLAASIQLVTEEVMLKTAIHLREVTKMRNLVLAGGVALNCVANGKLLRDGPFDNVWIQPAAGDAGGALGCALFAWYQLLENPRTCSGGDFQKGSLLGPRYTTSEIKSVLDAKGAVYQSFDSEAALLRRVAESMAQGKVIGWFSGRMEFGPRALGARSIIGDARNEKMQATMNLKIKYRESFRPFAPCVLKERAAEIFDFSPKAESPYMLMVAEVRDKYRRSLTADQERAMKDPDLRKRVNVCRSDFPAITHVDYSARLQTVDSERHGRYYRLMKEFERQTGSPIIVNTSFNVRGEPIVNTPEQALNCFLNTEMDVLVLEDLVLFKEEQPPTLANADAKKYLSQFSLD